MEEKQDDKLEQSQKSENKITFEKLTPTILADDKMRGYTEALDFVFEQDDLLNIAVTGPYASGKSSVIKTYEENRKRDYKRRYKNLNHIHISLAYFSPLLESKIQGKKRVEQFAFEDELMLERKIINQLIHQIDSDKIPATDFKVKSRPKKLIWVIWSAVISLLMLYVIYKDGIWLTQKIEKYPLFIFSSLAVFISTFVFMLISLQSRKNLIGKLKIFESEIDISSSECDVSYFDKYLDEIIYILDKSKLDFIVFEDIDRYDDNLILNKLRELNYTYNKRQIKKQAKTIKFFYLIKDEIFESKDRTKFFDYILPIVPIMDNSNSLGRMVEIFKKNNIKDDFSDIFLDRLSLYLDDIRLIKNICNEYIIYKNKLAHNGRWFKKEKLLATIIYKNIFPQDFSLTRLGLGQGVVHRIICSIKDGKNEIYKTEIERIDSEILSLKEKFRSNDQNQKSKLDLKILEKEKAGLQSPKKVTEIITFSEKMGTTSDELFKKHIDEKEKYRNEYEQLSSSCYFQLIKTLIMQGYIDEYYSDYTTFFDEKGLPRNDTLFLRNINERRSTPWELELKKPALVFERVTKKGASYFTDRMIFNFSLLDYILDRNKFNELGQYIKLCNSIIGFKFADAYLARSYALIIDKENLCDQEYLCTFIDELNLRLPETWQHITRFNKKLYLYLSFIQNGLFSSFQESVLKAMNKNGELKKFIDQETDFLLLDDEWNAYFDLLNDSEDHLTNISEAFEILDIQFSDIGHSTPQLLEIVERVHVYQLNIRNVTRILTDKYELKDFDFHLIQTLLDLDEKAPVRGYFQNKPEDLLLSITESDLKIVDDNEYAALYILNHDDISTLVKIFYIKKLTTIIQKLEDTTDTELWDALLENQQIAYTAENIIHYFFNYTVDGEDIDDKDREITEELVDFINSSQLNISSTEANLKNLIMQDDRENLFYRSVIKNPDLNNQKYAMLISWFNLHDPDFSYKNIDQVKISILIQHKIIKLGEEQDINFLRTHYADNFLELITHNFDDYINRLENDNSLVIHDEIVQLLSEDFTLDQKISLLRLTDDPISIQSSWYPEDIQKYILEHNFDLDDLTYITNQSFYSSATIDIKNIVLKLGVEHINKMLEIDIICFELLTELLRSKDISLNDKYILLTHQINHLSLEQAYNFFTLLESEPSNNKLFSRLFIGKKPKFENTKLNKDLLEKLNKKWEFSYRLDSKTGKFLAYGKQLIK